MCEVQDVFAAYGGAYRDTHPLSLAQSKAFGSVLACRTSALGGHTQVCPECGLAEQSYNSCKNRNCPKCQAYKREVWLERQSQDLLDVPYFHVVFTVPECLNVVFLHNQKELYTLLFRASAEAMAQMCKDPLHLGAKSGHTAVLHTWGQNLSFHPHVHCIVPSGGLSGVDEWKTSSKKFFLPVKALSKLFKGKFMAALKSMHLVFYNDAAYLNDETGFQALVDAAYAKDWVVYCKPPFRNAGGVLEYLGRYTHRVAIANSRLISCSGGKVAFRWRDYADNNKPKVMALDADEFIRRFLMHVLPQGFTKIRHYGILANRGRHVRMDLCKRLTKTPLCQRVRIDPVKVITRMLGRPPGTCRVCGAMMGRLPLVT
jgi:hypothetical protein